MTALPWRFDEDQGWISEADISRIRKIYKAMAVGRAKVKLTVFEYNALALHIVAEHEADQKAMNR